MSITSQITDSTKTKVKCDGFKCLARKRPSDFTRTRSMPFEEVVWFMLMRFKCSTSSALRRFFDKLEIGFPIRQQSFSESRYKIRHEAFIELFKVTVDTMLANCHKKWHGYRLLAIDGSKINLPQDAALMEYFGANGRGAKSCQCQGSLMYDVQNDIVLDAAIAPLSDDERSLAWAHLDECKVSLPDEKKLVLFDRGYPSFDLIEKLENDGFHYVMRARKKFNNDIDAQTNSDGFVWLSKGEKRIHIRVIKFALDSGEEETLITNITDKRLGKNAFKKLYFMRWPVETKYNIAKSKLQVENFTALTVEGVKQDFFAAMYLVNVAAAAAIDAQADIDAAKNTKGNKHGQKANTNELTGILKDMLVLALVEDDTDKTASMIQSIINVITHHTIPIRDNRSVPRKPYPRNVTFHHNRKVNC